MKIKKWFFGLNSDSEWTHNYERYINSSTNSQKICQDLIFMNFNFTNECKYFKVINNLMK